MSIKEIEYGALASSSELNDNFHYLEKEVGKLSDLITSKTASFASNVATLNATIKEFLDYKTSFIKTGMIMITVENVVPEGFLLCDGSEVNVSDYPDLYKIIGTMFGSSDSTKFGLPDLRNKTLWGADVAELGSELKSKLPNIKGQFRLTGTEGSSSVSGAFEVGSKGGAWGRGHESSASNPLLRFNANKYCDVYSDDVSVVQPPALAVNFIIKY